MLCGAADGVSTREPWDVNCPACLAVARAESVVGRTKPHPFRYTEHCASGHGTIPTVRYGGTRSRGTDACNAW
jgi:hypothetical protein